MFLSLNYYDTGRLQLIREVDPASLPYGLVGAFGDLIGSSSLLYRTRLDAVPRMRPELIWSQLNRTTATGDLILNGRIASTSALLNCPRSVADARATRVFGKRLVHDGRRLTQQIQSDLLQAHNRPVICSVIWEPQQASADEIESVIELQNCLAAAFFLRSCGRGIGLRPAPHPIQQW